MIYGPPASWYELRDEPSCCAAFENGETDEDHDPRDCVYEQQEARAEMRAEARAERDY